MQMKQYGGTIAAHLPRLWDEAQGHNMLQCTIVGTLKSFVDAMGTAIQPMQDGLAGIVNYCTDMASVSTMS
jgi:hypothetical protein